jgi:pimeloyl-ACP methyl ester carboxylesterase
MMTLRGRPEMRAKALPKAPNGHQAGKHHVRGIEYPYPVTYRLTLYGQDLRLADVPPAGQPSGPTVVLFHGMNFGGFYFAGPSDSLRKKGFRVVVSDHICCCRSSKPIIPYKFHDMALNSRRLLQSLGIGRVSIVGHSMGGHVVRPVGGIVSRYHRACRDLRSHRPH